MNGDVESALLVQCQYFLLTIALDYLVKPGDDDGEGRVVTRDRVQTAIIQAGLTRENKGNY
jgi:hypothetical protein